MWNPLDFVIKTAQATADIVLSVPEKAGELTEVVAGVVIDAPKKCVDAVAKTATGIVDKLEGN